MPLRQANTVKSILVLYVSAYFIMKNMYDFNPT